jgi:transglutaminase-like putative cysteine protease
MTVRCLLPALFLLAAPLAAQQVDPARTALLAAGDAASFPGAPFVVVYDSTEVDVMESGLSHVVTHRLVKVLTPAGARDLRNIVVGYEPLSAAVEMRLVRIHRANGRTETLTPDRIHDYPAPARAIYWGAREVLADVGRLDVGDGIETIVYRKGFTYALLANPDDDERFIPPMRGHFYDIVEFFSDRPMREKVYRVYMPADKPLQYEIYNGELQSSVLFPPTKTNRVRVVTNADALQPVVDQNTLHPTHGLPVKPGKITYTFAKKNIVPMKAEPGMVAWSDVAPKLLLSTSPDWYAKAVWFHNVNEDFGSFEVTPEIQALVDSLLRGVTSESEKISILNHWSAEEIRYSGISMGKGEGYTLHPGAMTFADRCGVCKDKAGILVTMLRAAGFESYAAMTMAGSRIDRIPADQFNHSVTVVKRSSGEWELLDPTWIPGVREMWSSAEQQQEFLLGLPDGADIMTTPISPADNHYWKLDGSSRLAADGTLEGELVLVAEGQTDANIRRQMTRAWLSSWREYIPRLLTTAAPAIEITDLAMRDPYDLSAPMRLSVKYRIPGYATVAGDRMSFVPFLARNPFNDAAMSGELATDTTLRTRQYGFRMRSSKLVEVRERITLPKGMRVVQQPSFDAVKGPAASFTGIYTTRADVLEFTATHRMEKRQYEAAEWPEFRAALIERLESMTTPVVLGK